MKPGARSVGHRAQGFEPGHWARQACAQGVLPCAQRSSVQAQSTGTATAEQRTPAASLQALRAGLQARPARHWAPGAKPSASHAEFGRLQPELKGWHTRPAAAWLEGPAGRPGPARADHRHHPPGGYMACGLPRCSWSITFGNRPLIFSSRVWLRPPAYCHMVVTPPVLLSDCATGWVGHTVYRQPRGWHHFRSQDGGFTEAVSVEPPPPTPSFSRATGNPPPTPRATGNFCQMTLLMKSEGLSPATFSNFFVIPVHPICQR